MRDFYIYFIVKTSLLGYSQLGIFSCRTMAERNKNALKRRILFIYFWWDASPFLGLYQI